MVASVTSPEPVAAPADARPHPAMPSATACVFLGCFAVLASAADRLLGDPDTLWHVAIGRSIAENRALPWTDTFSHTFAGAPWIAKEWLAQVLFAGAYAIGDWAGVALLAAAAAAAALALLHAFLARRLPAIPALAVTLVAALLCAPHLLARPHVLALPLIVLWTRGLVEAAQARTAPPWALALVMAAWANLHAGFTIGFALAGLAALEAVCSAPRTERLRRAAAWSGFLAAAIAAACATPYGYRSMLVTLTLFGSGEPLPYIVEWQPLAFDAVGALAAGLMVLVLAALLVRPRENLFRIAVIALLAAMTLRHNRFLELFALVAPLVAIDPILRLAPRLGGSQPPAQGSAAPERGSAAYLSAVAVIMLTAGLVAVLTVRQRPAPDPRNAPVAALAAARAQGVAAGKVYNAYDFGGFLIAEGVPTFIDGRSDQIFLGGFTRSVNAAASAAEDAPFLALIEAHAVSWALVRTGSDEARHLDRSRRWRPIHADPVARVFAIAAPQDPPLQDPALQDPVAERGGR